MQGSWLPCEVLLGIPVAAKDSSAQFISLIPASHIMHHDNLSAKLYVLLNVLTLIALYPAA